MELIERDALLFRAGEYPDRGLTVTEADLDRLVAGTTAGVPIKIEHADTPLDGALGFIKGIYRKGTELFGKLSITKPAWDLMESSGAKNLSVGFLRDFSTLTEVSIVRKPRVAGAAIFADTETELYFNVDLTQMEVKQMDEKKVETPEAKPEVAPVEVKPVEVKPVETVKLSSSAVKSEIAEVIDYLEGVEAKKVTDKKSEAEVFAFAEKIRSANADRLVDKFMTEGKITPASADCARAIFAARPLTGKPVSEADTVRFSEGGKSAAVHFADLFAKFLEANKPVINFAETALARKAEEFSAAELELAAKMGVSPEAMAKYAK